MWEFLNNPGKPMCPYCTSTEIITSGILDDKNKMYYECLDCDYTKNSTNLFVPSSDIVESLSRIE